MCFVRDILRVLLLQFILCDVLYNRRAVSGVILTLHVFLRGRGTVFFPIGLKGVNFERVLLCALHEKRNWCHVKHLSSHVCSKLKDDVHACFKFFVTSGCVMNFWRLVQYLMVAAVKHR